MAEKAGHIIKKGQMYVCSCNGSGLCRLACLIWGLSTSGAMVVVVVSRRTSVLEDYQSPFAIAPAVGASGPDARVVEHSRTWIRCGLASPAIGPYALKYLELQILLYSLTRPPIKIIILYPCSEQGRIQSMWLLAAPWKAHVPVTALLLPRCHPSCHQRIGPSTQHAAFRSRDDAY